MKRFRELILWAIFIGAGAAMGHCTHPSTTHVSYLPENPQ
jgi:hypothetical protein